MMKGGGGSVGKRRWRGLVIAILGLVLLSMLVPLGFLFGRFHSASTAVFVSDQQSSQSNGFWSFDRQGTGNDRDQSESMKHQSEADHVKELVEKFAPTISKDVLGNNLPGAKNQNIGAAFEHNQPEKVFPVPLPGLLQSVSSSNVGRVGRLVKTTRPNKAPISDNDKSCEVTFGSYCLWRREHKEAIKDAMVKKLKDRLFVAIAYYPNIAKLPDQEKFVELAMQCVEESAAGNRPTMSEVVKAIETILQKDGVGSNPTSASSSATDFAASKRFQKHPYNCWE